MYEGNPATVGTILDVTQHKKSEQAIQEAEERIRMATNATNTVVWDYDFKLQKSKFVVPEALAKDFTFAQNQGTTGLAESIYEPDRELLEKKPS